MICAQRLALSKSPGNNRVSVPLSSPELIRFWLKGTLTRFSGTYEVDTDKGIVVHRVEGSLMPSYTDTDQPRPFRIDGDVLTIEGDAEGIHFLRRFRRVR